MLCYHCQKRTNCIPAALAANDTYMFALLERLKKCDRYIQDQKAKNDTQLKVPGQQAWAQGSV